MPRRGKPYKRDRSRSLRERRDRQDEERNERRFLADGSSERRKKPTEALPRDSGVKQLLAGIGVPEAGAFSPDPFQLEALAAIEHDDVLVTAPTGSGKTWIAREEIRRLLERGKRTWYTTPLKALTNSKYVEFSAEFGAENVGILTGDRKENSSAPLIVGTTEIYRNQLFDALRQGDQVRTDLVILDEAHYLADDERGHVWEEAIILTPPRIRMLLLSATVGQAEAFASWIGSVRGSHVHVINRAGSRPVELRAGYISNELQLYPLLNEDGTFNRQLERFSARRESGSRPNRRRR